MREQGEKLERECVSKKLGGREVSQIWEELEEGKNIKTHCMKFPFQFEKEKIWCEVLWIGVTGLPIPVHSYTVYLISPGCIVFI